MIYIVISCPSDMVEERLTVQEAVEALDTPSVEEWLYYIKNCKFFVGDSFHGLCFSLIFNKPFLITVNSNVSGLQRFTTLLKMIVLEDRLFFTDKDDVRKIDEIVRQYIDYQMVNRIIKGYAKDSYEWLFNAIKSKKGMRLRHLIFY